MIAIMPNTISREILSAGRTTARVANRAKNNNEMSIENKGGPSLDGMGGRRDRKNDREVERRKRAAGV